MHYVPEGLVLPSSFKASIAHVNGVGADKWELFMAPDDPDLFGMGGVFTKADAIRLTAWLAQRFQFEVILPDEQAYVVEVAE